MRIDIVNHIYDSAGVFNYKASNSHTLILYAIAMLYQVYFMKDGMGILLLLF